MGRLDGAKNPWWTLDLAKAAVEADEPIVINIVGSGPYAEPLQRAARAARLSNVHFLGPVRHDEVGDVLRQSDVYLITSHYEGSSTSLVEALATGLPCLVTPGADQDHLVQVGINGFHLWGDPVRDLELVRQARALPRGSIPQTVAHRSIDKLLPAYLGYGQ